MHRRLLFLFPLLIMGALLWRTTPTPGEASAPRHGKWQGNADRVYLPLVFREGYPGTPPPTPTPPPSTPFYITGGELGLAFINSAEDNRSSTRIQRGVNSGAQLDRFPLYWDRIEPSNNQWNWSGQDAALRANEQQGLGTLAILLGTSPAHYPRALQETTVEPMPAIGGGPLRPEIAEELAMTDAAPEALMANGCTVQGTPPPEGLYEAIFTDGSDTPAFGKSVNGNNPWARFVDQAVQRYKPGGSAGRNVRYWEVWNEPDLCHFWGGTPQEYARMLKVAYLVIKHRDPQATVMWGGLAIYGPKYENGRNFLTEFVNTIRGDSMASQYRGFFDAATQHQYSNVVHGYRYAVRIKQSLAGTGWENKPIWVTESGVPVCDSYPGPACPSPYRATAADQAAYIWQNIAYTRIGNNGGPIFHFMLHDDAGNACMGSPPADGFGLVTNEPGAPCVPHSATPRPAYRAFQLADIYLSNVELVWADIQDGVVRRVAFYDPITKERRLLTWGIGGQDATAVIPAAGTQARRVSTNPAEQDILISPSNGNYVLAVSRATNQSQPNSATYTIGGTTYLLVERDTLPPQGSIIDMQPVSTSPFTVVWRVMDYGSPVQPNSVTIWVRENNGSWQPWRTGQNASGSSSFSGNVDSRYQFGITAQDKAGNATITPTVLAETRVVDENTVMPVSGIVRNTQGQPAAGVNVRFGNAEGQSQADGTFAFDAPVGQWNLQLNQQTVIEGQSHLQATYFDVLLPPSSNGVSNGWFEQVDGTGNAVNWTVGGSSPAGLQEQSGTRDNVMQLATAFVASPGVPGTENSAGGNSTISQVLTVPSGSPYLAFRYMVESGETDGGNGSCGNPAVLHDKFEVIIVAGTTPHYIHCQETASGWSGKFIDMSQFAGQSVTLIFNIYESSPNRRTSVRLDQVMVGQP